MADRKQFTASETLIPVPEIPAAVMNHIYYVADSMIGKSNLVEADRCDLIQEMSIAVCRAMTMVKRDGKTTIGTSYLNRAVDLTSKLIYRRRIRNHYDMPFLPIENDSKGKDQDGESAVIPQIEDSDRKILHHDIRAIVATLSDELRIICELIMDGYTFEQIAEKIGISDSAIRLRRMKEIRDIFVRNGINL